MPAFDLPPADLERHRPDVAEPADFDAFWKRTLGEAAGAGDVLVAAEPVDNGLRLTETWDVTFRGFAGDPVRGWFSRPAGTSEPLPAVVEFAGYGRGRGLPHERLTWVNAGFAHLLMDNRGQGDQYGCGGDTPDPHASAPGGPGPAVRGLLDPRDHHYRRLITDAVRAVDAVRALPGVDASRVAAVGNSQGGGVALAVAGLAPDLAAVLVTAPSCAGSAARWTSRTPPRTARSARIYPCTGARRRRRTARCPTSRASPSPAAPRRPPTSAWASATRSALRAARTRRSTATRN